MKYLLRHDRKKKKETILGIIYPSSLILILPLEFSSAYALYDISVKAGIDCIFCFGGGTIYSHLHAFL